MECKRVLVQIGSNKRPVSFSKEGPGGELLLLKKAVIETFSDVLKSTEPKDLLVQVKSEDWPGEYEDLLESDIIQDKSVLKVTANSVSSVQYSCIYSNTTLPPVSLYRRS